jgi:hypothetical protein
MEPGRPRRRGTPSFGSFLTNLDAPYPLRIKLRMLVRNLGLRVVKAQNCCGHPGEPGC